VRAKIRAIVSDPVTAEDLCPFDHHLGTKRLCSGTNYYETYNRDNVTLVNLRKYPILSFDADGINLADGHIDLDVVVLATGFDTLTGALSRIDVRGVDGVALGDKWHNFPSAYLGLMTAGFPNLFIVTGPGSPAVLSNMVTSIEQHVEWISDCITALRDDGYECIEATEDAEQQWVSYVNELASPTLYAKTTNSWYVGSNIPGKARVFALYIGGVGNYGARIAEVAGDGYRGFNLG
jgi:cation diffusion facilitator CzcD-associated flavoprotein CzcO